MRETGPPGAAGSEGEDFRHHGSARAGCWELSGERRDCYNHIWGVGRVVAGAGLLRRLRKVRTPQGRELGNAQAG